ncbi:MAG: hypothetical protein PPP56_05130 [Longimonas sp.]|uniref:hypothetical protein n=1 Tax=Longimonas sp. TaxID=2039626 RepID=UPI003364621F
MSRPSLSASPPTPTKAVVRQPNERSTSLPDVQRAPDTQALASPDTALRYLNQVPGLSGRKRTLYGTWIHGYLSYLKRERLGTPRAAYMKRFLSKVRDSHSSDESIYQSAAEALVFYHERLLRQTVCDDGYRLATLTEKEKRKIIARIQGPEKVLALVVCYTELNLKEALRLRVGDIEVEKRSILVSSSSGTTDRAISFPASIQDPLRKQLKHVRRLHDHDLEAGYGTVDLPNEVARQFPWASKQFVWQYLFPSEKRTLDIRAGTKRRYPMTPKRLFSAIEASDAPLTQSFDAVKE